ncbi:MAG: MlaD family protein [Gordonia sp. (in: high G+C Gram-positive bacteria)]|uniref:MlaD family protein n=1 Tax=Gordonia sp. (in: high G+C Gram-positive bacteria) TaxID=84139 RepID=UPI0039E286C7
MLKKLLGSKWLVSGLAIGMAVVLGLAYLGYQRLSERTVTHCAELADGIGLFPGNAVMRRGVRIGTVEKIEPGGGFAKVTFKVDQKFPLPADAEATSVSPSIIAVRQLAILGDPAPGGSRLGSNACIPLSRTATPASISQALQSVNRIADELTNGSSPEQSAKVMSSLASIAKELDGVGPVLNGLIKQLAVPARTPMTGALADMATSLDHTSALAGGLADNWGVLKQVVEAVNQVTDPLAVPILKTMARIAYALPEILTTATPLVAKYQHFAWPALDVILPITRMIGAGFRNWGDLLGILPVLIRAFHVAFDQKTFGLRISYKPPRTQIPAKNPRLTCANVNRFLPNQCKVIGPDKMELDALRAVMLFTGAGRP